MDSTAALALKRLKAEAPRALDSFVWYALAERLAAKGYWAAWMLDHVIARCPHPTQRVDGEVVGRCGSRLKFRPGVGKLEGVCAKCPHEHGAVDEALVEYIGDIYRASFDEEMEARLL